MKGISRLRRLRGWTQQDLARKMGVSPNTIYRWESANPLYSVSPGIKSLKKMSLLFDCTIEDLIDNNDPFSSSSEDPEAD